MAQIGALLSDIPHLSKQPRAAPGVSSTSITPPGARPLMHSCQPKAPLSHFIPLLSFFSCISACTYTSAMEPSRCYLLATLTSPAASAAFCLQKIHRAFPLRLKIIIINRTCFYSIRGKDVSPRPQSSDHPPARQRKLSNKTNYLKPP